MNLIIIGNIIAFFGSILMVVSGYVKSKKIALFIQAIELSLFTAACFCLGAISGAIVNMISIPRDILVYKDKLNLTTKFIIWITTVGLSIWFNDAGLIGYLPIMSTTIYTFWLDRVDKINFKILTIVAISFWVVYDFIFKAYVGCTFDLLTVIASSIAIYRIHKDNKKNTELIE